MKHIKLFESFSKAEVLNEALNKDIKAFGTDLGKYLKNGGFDVKFLNAEITQDQKKSIKDSKNIVALEVNQNNEMQSLYLHFNPSQLSKIKAIVDKFQLSDYNGPVLSRGWTSKQVKGAINPGDICKDIVNIANGLYVFYRLAKVDTKVKDIK